MLVDIVGKNQAYFIEDPEWIFEFICEMIDVFDTFLWPKNIDLHNPEKMTPADEDFGAIIYGSDRVILFRELFDAVTRHIEC